MCTQKELGKILTTLIALTPQIFQDYQKKFEILLLNGCVSLSDQRNKIIELLKTYDNRIEVVWWCNQKYLEAHISKISW